MGDNVRNSGRVSNNTGTADPSLTALLDALKSGDTEAALSAAGALLRGRGGNVTGSPKDKGFGAQLKQVFNDVKDRLTGPERKAVTEAIARDAKPTTASTTDETAEPRTTADANTMSAARRHAVVAERARRTAMEQRVDVENMGGYVGVWNPKVAAAAVEKLETAQTALELERKSVNEAMGEIRHDIKTLEGKPKRSEAEDLLLEGKRGQLQSFEQLGQVLDARIDQMKRAKGALKYDNFENEVGKNEVSRDEAMLMAQQGAAIDQATEQIAQSGRLADSNVLRATQLLEQQGATAPNAPATTKKTEDPKVETTKVEDKKLLSKEDLDKTVTSVAMGVGTDKTKINSASAIFGALEGKSPEQIAQIKDAYNTKYGKAGKDASGAWEGGWDFDKNVRGNMHTWNKQAFDALAAGKPDAKQLIADGAKKDQEVNAGKIKADFTEPKVETTKVDDKKLLSKDELDKAVASVALGVGTDKTKINSASAIFGALEGKSPEQIAQIKDAYNTKYGKAGKDTNGAWEGGWDFDKNVRGNMHTWNKQAFDALAAGKPEAKQLIADGAKKDQEVNAGKIKADFTEPKVETTKVDDKKLLSKDELDKAVTSVAMGVGTDKSKINSASAIFSALEGKSPEQIAQIKDAYNTKYGKAGKDANGAWEGGWDFDKNVRGNMHTWNKQAFDALAAGKPEAKQLIADGAKKDQEVNAGKIKADFTEPKVEKPVVTVKEGDWLSRIAANAKNKDGSTVTLEQLRQQPENKYLFDRNAAGDLIHPGDKVTLPEGATHPAVTAGTSGKPEVTAEVTSDPKTATNKPRTGLKKPDAEVKPDATTATTTPTTYAQLSDKQVNDAVASIASGVGANKGEMKSAGQVFDAVNGMSPNQITQVRDAYNQKFGAQGWDFDKHVVGSMFPWNQKAFSALEKGDAAGAAKLREEGKKLDQQVAADTKTLRDAVEGGGTNEKAIFDTLKKHQNNPEMLRAIEQQYKTQFKEDLRSRVDGELKSGDFGEFRNSNDDAIRAKALFDGKPNVASAALLHSLLADGSSNAEVALQVMTKEITPERRKAVAEEFKKLYGKTPEQMVREWPMWDGNAKADLIIAARDMSR